MSQCKGDMASPRGLRMLVAALCVISVCRAGPLGPLPNVTSLDLGLKEGGCALGDVVYMPGDEFPGESACERCRCARGGVECARQQCQPRPGCKALHRPDHCCPTYQCECEQEGRVYDNGEKLVDPQDPCRVCYCQGGEVVCRRIACFVRDDCTPRRVPGRCCPEYDNCPLRGVTTIPGVAPAVPSISALEDINAGVVPTGAKETNKPPKNEITIKEITPVSEIPVITEVKIKEIPPSPSIDVAEYSSSKSPLIPREATSEKSDIDKNDDKLESPEISNDETSLSSVPTGASKSAGDQDSAPQTTNDAAPSKISLSTQDSINNNIYTSSLPIAVATVGSPSTTQNVVSLPPSKSSMNDDEDSSLFDHNPAFPPIPDDLSVVGNHEEELFTEQNMDTEHASVAHEVVNVASTTTTSTEAVTTKQAATTTSNYISEATSAAWENSREISLGSDTTKSDDGVTIVTAKSRESSMLNLRSVLPTDIINVPSHIALSVEMSDGTVAPTTVYLTVASSTEEDVEASKSHSIDSISTSTDDPDYTEIETVGNITESSEQMSGSHFSQRTTSSISKSNIGTEVTSQTELSSLPIETSDQNPHDTSENITKERASVSTVDPLLLYDSDAKLWQTNATGITVSKIVPTDTENQSFESLVTTEFGPSAFGSQESATIGVESIKSSSDSEKSSALIDQSNGRNNNVLTDLINLVGDVASIGDHTDGSDEHHTASPTTISDSEELIPVNAGYKSKNKNWNLNSITEVPLKSKGNSKSKVVEIEDEDDTDSITDSPAPNNKVEPTTRRPIIDNVSDEKRENKTGNKDIEIITQSYVPTINRRPTKVIMKTGNEKLVTDEPNSGASTTEPQNLDPSVPVTDKSANSDESTVAPESEAATAAGADTLVQTTDVFGPAQ